MISTNDLEAIAAGRVIDSTQAPQIARELIAAREYITTLNKYQARYLTHRAHIRDEDERLRLASENLDNMEKYQAAQLEKEK